GVLAAVGVPQARRGLRAGRSVGRGGIALAAGVARRPPLLVVGPAFDPQPPIPPALPRDSGSRRRPERRPADQRRPPPSTGRLTPMALASPAVPARPSRRSRAHHTPRWPWLVPIGVFFAVGMSPRIGLPLVFAAVM